MGQDPYGDQGGFTPYQPDATPDSEPPAAGAAEESAAHPPYVPYGDSTGTYAAPLVATTAKTASRRLLPWLVGFIVVIMICGGGVAGIIGSLAGSDGSSGESSGSSSGGGLLANELEAGQCLIGAGLDPGSNEPVSGLEVVDCSTGHDAEVIAVNVLDAEEAAAYDFEDDDGAFDSCRDYFSPAQMELLNRPDLYLIALTESQNPVTSDKVACLLTREDGKPLHGSLNTPTPEPPISPS